MVAFAGLAVALQRGEDFDGGIRCDAAEKLSARTAKLGWMKIGQPFGVVAEAGVGACADDLLNFQPDRLGAADEIDGR